MLLLAPGRAPRLPFHQKPLSPELLLIKLYKLKHAEFDTQSTIRSGFQLTQFSFKSVGKFSKDRHRYNSCIVKDGSVYKGPLFL